MVMVTKRFMGQHIHIHYNIIQFQRFRYPLTPSKLFNIQGNLMALSKSELLCLNVESMPIQFRCKCLGIFDGILRILVAKFHYLIGRDRHLSQGIKMVIAG